LWMRGKLLRIPSSNVGTFDGVIASHSNGISDVKYLATQASVHSAVLKEYEKLGPIKCVCNFISKWTNVFITYFNVTQ
jgi:hypothetical protein